MSRERLNISRVRLNDLDLDVIVAMVRTTRYLESMVTHGISTYGLSKPQFDVLAKIFFSPEKRTTVTEAAQDALVSKANMTGIITRLLESELVVRESDPNDARVRFITLTDAGSRLVQKVLPKYFDMTHEAMSIFSKEEKELLLKQLEHIETFLQMKQEQERK